MTVRPGSFQLVPEDLLDQVVFYGQWLETQGFKIDCEPSNLEYPYLPVMMGRRERRTYIFDVSSRVDLDKARAWVAYGRASNSDTRLVLGLTSRRGPAARNLAALLRLGVGLDLLVDGAVQQMTTARDLSMSIEFPVIPTKFRAKFAHARELFDQGNWEEAFEDACLVLETAARLYLRRAVRSGRASFVSSRGKTVNYTEEAVGKMTLGALGDAFALLANPSQAESRTAQALKRINPNRVNVAHYKKVGGRRGKQLRETAGKDFIVIVNTMALLS